MEIYFYEELISFGLFTTKLTWALLIVVKI